MTRFAAALAALCALACAAPIRTEVFADDHPPAIRSVALVPLRVGLMTSEAPSDAAQLATARVGDALESETGLRVVEVAQADAILSGTVRRWIERDGSASGVRHPASVWLVLELRSADGRVLWTGNYEETQTALSEDAGSLPRAWDRGFRWVTAAELADYGARELVRELAREISSWS